MKKATSDLALAAIAIAAATIYLVATYNLRTLVVVDPLGPKAFPALLGILMLLCGISLAITSWQRYRSQVSSIPEDESGARNSHPIAVGAVASWLLGYYLVFEPLGFVLATIFFLFGLMVYFNRGHWLTNAIVAILFPVVLDFIFSYVLGLTPAQGLLSL